MKKNFLFCSIYFVIIMLVVSCTPDQIGDLGNTLQGLGNNVIGAKKDYTKENEELAESVDSVIEDLTSTDPSSETGNTADGLISSLKQFSNAPVIENSSESGDYKYEKRVDLSGTVATEEQESVKTSLGKIWDGGSSKVLKTSNSKTLSSTQHQELDMSTYTVKTVIEAAKTQLNSFLSAFSDYSADSAVRKAVNLAKTCMDNAVSAVITAVSHLDDGQSVTYEDVVVMTLANGVKNEYGQYAVDSSYRGREIIAALGNATDYLDVLTIMGIIPKFNAASLLLELTDYFNEVD